MADTQDVSHSIWNETLESLYQDLEAAKPAPAGVTAAAVSARLGLGLLIKTLEVARKRKNFSGDAKQAGALIEAARRESAKLAAAADEDITADAARRRSEIPMQAAGAAEAGLALCEDARGIVTGAITADLEAAALLLQAGLRAIQVCVRSNLKDPRVQTIRSGHSGQ
jgi:formiminotetrahydrofolate cyclodeaminase